MLLPLRRQASALCLLVYLAGTGVAPFVHLAEHERETPQEKFQSIDLAQFQDKATGEIDLQRLAVAVGLNEKHDESRPHSHVPGGTPSSNPLEHGAGAVEHFGLALLSAQAMPIVLATIAPPLPPPLPVAAPQPVLPPQHLKVQRAQAPPA